ncbi:MAG: flippase-like domain-containing protein [Chloroflexi bacterium]|nr:flippase-like domain-containing protein [Chloroflexota bacterium]
MLVYLFSRQGWGEIFGAIRQIPVWHIILAFVLTIISRLAVAGRWHALLAVTEIDVTWWKTLQLTFAGLFASNFLPTTVGGDVVRLAGAVQMKLDSAISTASLVVDRLVGLFGMALAVPLGAGPLWAWLITAQGWRDAFLTSSILPLGIKKIAGRMRDLFSRLWKSFSLWKDHPTSLLVSLGMTGLHMLCLYLSIALMLNSIGDPMPVWLIGGLWSFVYLVTLLPISINGYGVQEISLTLIFTNVGGISMKSGLTIALLIRTLQMVASLPGAAFVPAIIVGLRQDNGKNV